LAGRFEGLLITTMSRVHSSFDKTLAIYAEGMRVVWMGANIKNNASTRTLAVQANQNHSYARLARGQTDHYLFGAVPAVMDATLNENRTNGLSGLSRTTEGTNRVTITGPKLTKIGLSSGWEHKNGDALCFKCSVRKSPSEVIDSRSTKPRSNFRPLATELLKSGFPGLQPLLAQATAAELTELFKQSRSPRTELSALDALLSSRTPAGHLVFDARKLLELARVLGEPGPAAGNLATALGDPRVGALMNGVHVAAYLCLADSPLLKRPLMLTPEDALEEARCLSRKRAQTIRSIPAPVNAQVTAQGIGTVEYRGLAKLLGAMPQGTPSGGFPITSVWAADKRYYDPGQRLGDEFRRTDRYQYDRWVDSVLLMLASGHPDGFRYAVNNEVPMRFAVASWVRNPADLVAFGEEFGLARYDTSQGKESPVVPFGLIKGFVQGFGLPRGKAPYTPGFPIGVWMPEFDAKVNCEDLRHVHATLRTAAQIRRGSQARKPAVPALADAEARAPACSSVDIL
jgi:hypothetical protein